MIETRGNPRDPGCHSLTSRTYIMLQTLISHANDDAWTLALLAGVSCTLATTALVGLLAYCRVRAQKSRLDTALNNICQGLTMFDRSGCLILCNRRYIEMYGLSADVIKPGCTVRQVVEHRIETGSLTARRGRTIRRCPASRPDPGKGRDQCRRAGEQADHHGHAALDARSGGGLRPTRTSANGARRKPGSPTWRTTMR